MKERTKAILRAADLVASGKEEFSCMAIEWQGTLTPRFSVYRYWYEFWFRPERSSAGWLGDDANTALRLTFLAFAAAVSETEK